MANLLTGITAALRHLGARQEVIANNIANADTPGFKARTVERPDFGALLDGAAAGRPTKPLVERTAGMAALGSKRGGPASVLDRKVSETKPDGNNVSLEDQLLAMGEVQADYATLTSLYRKQLGLLKTALGGRGG